MLSISDPCKGASGIADYYLKGKEDYYLKGLASQGEWLGEGAKRLGLKGPVDRATFVNLLDGFSPDRKHALVQNAGSEDRQCCWDLTFSAPKSVSVLWALATPEVRKEIEEAHLCAVKKAFQFLQDTAGVTRRGKGGMFREPAHFVAACFLEGTSRAEDMQLHGHVVLINVGVRDDGSTGALMTRLVFIQKMNGGAAYKDELASQLVQRLAVTIEPREVGFHIQGVPELMCAFYSKRREEIEQVMAERGLSGAVAAKQIALETRPGKESTPSDELFARWRAETAAMGWSTEQAMKLVRPLSLRQAEQEQMPKAQSNGLTNEPTGGQGVEEQVPQAQPDVLANGQRKSHAAPKQIPEVQTLTRPTQPVPEPVRPTQQAPVRKPQPTIKPAHGQRPKIQGRTRNPNVRSDKKVHRLVRVEWKRVFDETPWIPAKERLVYLAWNTPFPNAPLATIRTLKMPAIAISLPRLRIGPPKDYHRKWGAIEKKWNLALGELRLQRRHPFAKLSKSNPLHHLSFPALRLTAHKSESPQPVQWNHDQKMTH
jgi:conjugative relaxase-like TrwC/TraI family protein